MSPPSVPRPQLIRQWLPEFEALTGAKVQLDTPAFPVYNQRADTELSTRGSSYDVVNVTFIYTSRWINAGWLTPLDEFVANLTPADWGYRIFCLLPRRRKPDAMANCTASRMWWKPC